MTGFSMMSDLKTPLNHAILNAYREGLFSENRQYPEQYDAMAEVLYQVMLHTAACHTPEGLLEVSIAVREKAAGSDFESVVWRWGLLKHSAAGYGLLDEDAGSFPKTEMENKMHYWKSRETNYKNQHDLDYKMRHLLNGFCTPDDRIVSPLRTAVQNALHLKAFNLYEIDERGQSFPSPTHYDAQAEIVFEVMRVVIGSQVPLQQREADISNREFMLQTLKQTIVKKERAVLGR
jgi:hypothetical protein